MGLQDDAAIGNVCRSPKPSLTTWFRTPSDKKMNYTLYLIYYSDNFIYKEFNE